MSFGTEGGQVAIERSKEEVRERKDDVEARDLPLRKGWSMMMVVMMETTYGKRMRLVWLVGTRLEVRET